MQHVLNSLKRGTLRACGLWCSFHTDSLFTLVRISWWIFKLVAFPHDFISFHTEKSKWTPRKPKSMVPWLKGESLREPKASHPAPAVNTVLVPQVLETCPLHQRGPRELVITHTRTSSHTPELGGAATSRRVWHNHAPKKGQAQHQSFVLQHKEVCNY